MSSPDDAAVGSSPPPDDSGSDSPLESGTPPGPVPQGAPGTPGTRPGPVPQGPSLPGTPPLRGSPPEGTLPTGHPDGHLPAAGGEAAAAAVEDDIDALDVLTATAKERDEYLDALRRLQADFENYKKRMLRQQTETLERGAEELVLKLLPVLDTVDLARQHGEGEAIEPIAAGLLDVLSKEGLERIDPIGSVFDPNEHEAVAHEPAEGSSEPVVAGLMRAGYRWRGRLVRAAMVTVKG